MFQVSRRQLLLLIALVAVVSATLVSLTFRFVDKKGVVLEPTVIADPSVASDEQNNIDVYRSVSPGVVNITAVGYQESLFGVFPSEGSGSGSIIDDRGHILTNYHVVQNAQKLEVQINNDKFSAKVVGTDRDDDLAVIGADIPSGYKLSIVQRGKSAGLEVGQKVLAIGNPFGLQKTLTTGVISGLQRPLFDNAAQRTINGLIQTDASINPGNSGGPLLNAKGEMIGINTAILSPNQGGSIGIGFAVPIDIANRVIPDLVGKGYVSRPWLGIGSVPVPRNIADRYNLPAEGLLVTQVAKNSGAAAAGVRPAVIRRNIWGDAMLQDLGDVILTIDGKKVNSIDDLQQVLSDRQPGETVQMEVVRQGNRLTVPVRLGERPAEQR
ncbi:MAG TPA: trypsin-like peptidase domain-containing protein [Blastocatellia bacterium]|nr:trypsin-like peptidase domain-containing protein [Blastocatellia bacterium]